MSGDVFRSACTTGKKVSAPVDGSTVQTRTFEYDAHLRLTTEKLPAYLGSRWLTYTFEDGTGGTVNGRPSGYQLGVSGTPAQDLTILLGYSGTTSSAGTLGYY